MATKGQKFKHYSEELKKEVVMERIEKNTSFLELAYRHGISSQESIMQWVKNYQKHGDLAFNDKRGSATAASSPLKGRPRKKFKTEEDKNRYDMLVKERNHQRSIEKKRLARVRAKRAEKHAEEESKII